MAGGYDPRVTENIQHLEELRKKSLTLNLKNEIEFLKSPSNFKKLDLLHTSDALLYTPSNEHFGIVPVEAMYAGLPVVAVNSGGPLETVVDGETGFLRESSADDFCEAMVKLVEGGEDLKRKMGENGRKRVKENFSYLAFADKLNAVIRFH